MLGQLALIGYILVFIFTTENPLMVFAVLSVILGTSAWIALRTVKPNRKQLYFTALLSIFVGGTSVLILITQGVLQIDPWFQPQYLIPLAGMIYAYSMNA